MKRPAAFFFAVLCALGVSASSFAGPKEDEAYSLVERAGRVTEPYDFKMDATVLREKNGQEVFGKDHKFFVEAAPGQAIHVGDVYTIYRKRGHVRRGWKDLGVLFQGVGVARITHAEGETIMATVEKQYDGVRPGDGMRLQATEQDEYEAARSGSKSISAGAKPDAEKGSIVRLEQGRIVAAAGDMVYLDLGVASGLVSGKRLAVYREGKTSESEGVIGQLGEIEILSVQKNVSTAVVIKATLGMTVGDQVLPAK